MSVVVVVGVGGHVLCALDLLHQSLTIKKERHAAGLIRSPREDAAAAAAALIAVRLQP